MTTPAVHILVIDDESQIRKLLRNTLEAASYKVTLADSAESGVQLAKTSHADAVILDLGLPDADGIEVLKSIRSWAAFPVLILTVRSSEQDIVSALDAGANDYLTKPFRGGELIARLRAALRIYNSTSERASTLTVKSLSIDLDGRIVRKHGELLTLTPTEFSLLALFVRNAGRVLTHKYILQQVWGPAFEGETQYTRVYVGQLRKKLEDDPDHPSLIVTESGIGYRFSVE
ncbi:MAG: response regulator transcription factor [Ignavibacteriales bacterium]|nr:response regulator transcription factor [Ignavibacteriales bacterium]